MIIKIKVKTHSQQDKVETTSEKNAFIVHTKKLPVKGEANQSIIKILAKYFYVSRNAITIKSGLGSRNKIVEIAE